MPSGISDTGESTEERRYFASGKSLSEQRQTRTNLGRNRDAHCAGAEVCVAGRPPQMARSLEAGPMGQAVMGTPAERDAILRQDEAYRLADIRWAERHGAVEGGGIVLTFPQQGSSPQRRTKSRLSKPPRTCDDVPYLGLQPQTSLEPAETEQASAEQQQG